MTDPSIPYDFPDPSEWRSLGSRGIRVAITDIASGIVETQTVVNDVLVITAGNHHVHHVQKYANGTTIWTIKTTKDTHDQS